MDEMDTTASGSTTNSDSPPQPLSYSNPPPTLPIFVPSTSFLSAVGTMPIESTAAADAAGVIPVAGDSTGKNKTGIPGNIKTEGYITTSPPPGFHTSANHLSDQVGSSKRGRGRPPGSVNRKRLPSMGELLAITAGDDFTPHILTVPTGEDVAAKIFSFVQNSNREICILSAVGSVSNVTIQKSDYELKYEGRFDIVTLAGSFSLKETGGVRNKTGGLYVSLAGLDGFLIGGNVSGLLTAASPIQLVLGSFIPNNFGAHKKKPFRYDATLPSAIPSVEASNYISQARADVGTSFSRIAKLDTQGCLSPMYPTQVLGQSQQAFRMDVDSQFINSVSNGNGSDFTKPIYSKINLPTRRE